MAEKLISLKLPPGFVNNGTTYQTKGRYHDGNLVRFFQGNIQPVGGWVSRTWTGATILGVPRAAHSWMLSDGTVALAIGTTHGLYVVVGTVVYDLLPGGAALSNNVLRTWTMDNFGYYLVANNIFEGNITPGFAAGGGTCYQWDGNVANPATQPLNNTGGQQSPAYTLAVCVTPEQYLTLLGGSDPNGIVTPSGTPSVRTVFWASQSTTDTWLATASNTAGAFELATSGTLVAGKRIRGQTLIWTTTDVWAMTFIGAPFAYSFSQVGEHCGLISSRAAITQDTSAIWMGQNGFFAFDGFVKPLTCEVQDKVFNDINRTLARNIWALANPTFGEVTWFYVSAAGSEIDRYVTYNYREGHWATGALARTAGITQQVPGTVPVMFDSAGVCYDHETASVHTGGATIYLESGPIELGDGDQVFSANRLIPDASATGDVTVTLFGAYRPLSSETTYGPYALANEPANIRVKARQIRVKFTQATADNWRIGDMRLGVVPSGRR